MPENFFAAYDALLDRWPTGTTELAVPTPYGPTRVHAHGPADGPPLVLLHGGGATGPVWYANAPALGARHRLYAVDLLGDAGRSRREGLPLRSAADQTAWLTAVLDGLGVARANLCGHSYGAWVAVGFAVAAPDRVERLALLDPTNCFSGYRPGYLLRALPMLLRPSARRADKFLTWETAGVGAEVDPGWRRLYALGVGEYRDKKVVVGGRAAAERLSMPTLVLLAGCSRVHDAEAVAAKARRALPDATVEVLPGLSHHAMPMVDAAGIDGRLLAFLG